MKTQDLADIFGIPPNLLEQTGAENYSELRARMLEQRRLVRAISALVAPAIDDLLAKIMERVLAHLILEVESDQRIKGFDTTGYV